MGVGAMWTENQGPEARVTHAVLGVQLKGVAGAHGPVPECAHVCVLGGGRGRRSWQVGLTVTGRRALAL